MRFFRKIFFLFLLASLFWPSLTARGAESITDPAFNTLCWREADCVKAREDFLRLDPNAKAENAAKGWIKELPCSQKKGWGMCLPAGKTVTSISLGGKREFTDVGDYIKTVYNYALSIAAILAVIMIIVAGTQWVMSGGNSEQITSARKRIVGSIVGLLIAYLSYVILNTINPALVNMRLPQAYMIRPYKVPFQLCADYDKETKFAKLENQKTKDQKELESLYAKLEADAFGLTLPGKKDEFKCGDKFFIENSNASVCYGEKCAQADDGCVPKTEEIKNKLIAKDRWQADDENKDYVCYPAKVVLRISYQSGQLEEVTTPFQFREGWNTDAPVGKGMSELLRVCGDGSAYIVSTEKFGSVSGGGNQTEFVGAEQTKIDSASADCGSKGFKGFVVVMSMRENWDPMNEDHYVGKNGSSGRDMGDREFFSRNAAKYPQGFFISSADLARTLSLNIAAADIRDIDCHAERGVTGAIRGLDCSEYAIKYADLLKECSECK